MRTFSIFIVTVALLVGSVVGVAGQSAPEARPPIPSTGCGSSDFGPGRHTGEAGFPWLLLVPDTHDGATPVPLVISLHAGLATAYDGFSQFADVGEDEGIAVVAPAHDRLGAWMYWYEDEALDPTLENPDVARMVALLDELDARLCLDRARIYATGLSGGASGTSILGCALEDRIAAIAPVAIGVVRTGAVCPLDRAMPTLSIDGVNDFTHHWSGGLTEAILDDVLPSGVRWRDTTLVKADGFDLGKPVPERVADVAVHNGCEPEPVIEPLGRAKRYVWECPGGAEVGLIAHGGDHEWDSVTDGRSTEELIWEFFEQHPMPE